MNMSKYVDVEKILNDKGRATCFPHTSDLYYHESVLQYAPAEDVAPVIHAHWIKRDKYVCDSDLKPIIKTGEIYICSRCKLEEKREYPYCHCGAKMDEEVD